MRTPIRLATFSIALALLSALPVQVDAQSRVPSSRGAVRGGGPAVRGPAVARPVVRGPVGGPVGGQFGSHYRAGSHYYPYYSGYRSSFYLGVGYPGYWYSPYWYSPWSFSIGFGSGYGYPYGYGYGYSYAPGWGYPYGSPGYQYGPYPSTYYPYGYPIDDATSDVRIDVPQITAEVYVDGYRAGIVDDFDGLFQRLHVRPGEHELVLYLKGYRTVREPLFLNARSTKTIRLDMAELGPGESSEPPPAPAPRAERDRDPAPDPRSQRPYDRPVEPEQRIEIAPATRFGTLSMRIQPGDAEVWIDGERWTTTPGDSRITIKLSPGRHKIEIRKDGFEHYSEEIGVRENTVFPLNVSLKKAQ